MNKRNSRSAVIHDRVVFQGWLRWMVVSRSKPEGNKGFVNEWNGGKNIGLNLATDYDKRRGRSFEILEQEMECSMMNIADGEGAYVETIADRIKFTYVTLVLVTATVQLNKPFLITLLLVDTKTQI